MKLYKKAQEEGSSFSLVKLGYILLGLVGLVLALYFAIKYGQDILGMIK